MDIHSKKKYETNKIVEGQVEKARFLQAQNIFCIYYWTFHYIQKTFKSEPIWKFFESASSPWAFRVAEIEIMLFLMEKEQQSFFKTNLIFKIQLETVGVVLAPNIINGYYSTFNYAQKH